MFDYNPLFTSDGYKLGHYLMLAKGCTNLAGTWIPRSLKHAPAGIKKIVSFGQQLTWKRIHDLFATSFFGVSEEEALNCAKDFSQYLGSEYDAEHFRKLWKLGYLPVKVKALPEGIETLPNVPHMTFINTVEGFAWLTLYLETPISNLSWKSSTSATLALQFRRNVEVWVDKTDKERGFLKPYLCHDFSARGLSESDMVTSGLGHATSFRGSDTLAVLPAARKYYNEPDDNVAIESVNASEHSVTCTQLFYYERRLRVGLENDVINKYYSFDLPCEGDVDNPDYLAIAEYMNLKDWLKRFPTGILSYVGDTMNLWKVITHVIPRLKAEILAREGKLVIRPDSGDPVDIICGKGFEDNEEGIAGGWYEWENGVVGNPKYISESEHKGVIELLWDIFGGTVNEQGYKVLDSHIGAIYGDSINLERQIAIYERLEVKGFACTNIVLGVGSFTYQFNTRDTFGWAAKGCWFKTVEDGETFTYNIYKDPITDDGTKKSLKGLCAVFFEDGEYIVKQECTEEEEETGILQTIYLDGKSYNETSLTEVRENINKLAA